MVTKLLMLVRGVAGIISAGAVVRIAMLLISLMNSEDADAKQIKKRIKKVVIFTIIALAATAGGVLSIESIIRHYYA